MSASYISSFASQPDHYSKPPTPAHSMHSLSSIQRGPGGRNDTSFWKSLMTHLLLWVIIIAYALICPFTKVEESFNVQAIHDIVRYGISREALEKYDHRTFPGVVPRTFIGALILSPLVKVFIFLLGSMLPNDMYALRLAIAFVGCIAVSYTISGVSRALGPYTAISMAWLMMTQFHYNFYLSRPLPNTYASIACLFVFGLFLRRKNEFGLALLTFASVVFRHELSVLVIANLGMYAGFRMKNCGPAFFVVIVSAIAGLILCLLVDSYFWGFWVVPEVSVFRFNILEGKSSQYGVSPWHWYITHGLTKSIPISAVLTILGMVSKVPGWKMSVPSALYLAVFSLIPHKELRFLFPVFPVFSLIGGSFLTNIKHQRPTLYSIMSRFVTIAQCALFVSTIGRVYVSYWNYPGGIMHLELSKFWSREKPASIHVDTLTAMTGFTRFTEDAHPAWHFDKSEVFEPLSFDFIVSSDSNTPAEFDRVSEVNAFTGFNWYPWEEIINDAKILKLRLPFHMNITPTIFIYKRVAQKEASTGKYQQSSEIQSSKSVTNIDQVTNTLNSEAERNNVVSQSIIVPENDHVLRGEPVGHVSNTFEETSSTPPTIGPTSEMPQQEYILSTAATLQQSSQFAASVSEISLTEENKTVDDGKVSTSSTISTSVPSESSASSMVEVTDVISNLKQTSKYHSQESPNMYVQPESDDGDVEELDEESGESILDHEL